MRTLRWWMLGLAAMTATAVAVVAYYEYVSSRKLTAPSEAEIRASFDRAALWIVRRRSQVLSENNAMLWLFVREAGRLTANEQLGALAVRFQNDSARGTVNQFLFEPENDAQSRAIAVQLDASWAPYQRLFVYGATCNSGLSLDPGVLSQLSPDACTNGHLWFRNPWCRTHQLMGLRFVQKNHCEPDAQIAHTIALTQSGILQELIWDFRLEDAYLQKVWTLIESGQRDAIRPVWIRRILDAQQPDGGWSEEDVILRLPGDRALSWSGSLYPRIGPLPQSDFHATAQGLYLMALLLSNHVSVTAP